MRLDEQELCRRTFLRLTQPGEGTEDTKRRASMQELLSLSGKSTAEENIIQKLADASLLTTEGDLTHKDAFVEVAHEALIRDWPRLRQWLDEDRAGLRLHHRISEVAQEWQRSNKEEGMLYRGARLTHAQEWRERHDAELNLIEREFLDTSIAERLKSERQQRQRQRLLIGAAVLFAVLFIAAAGFAIFGFLQKSEAERQKSTAEKEANAALHAEQIAKEQKTLAEQQKVEAERQTRLATEAQRTAEKQAVLAHAAEDKAKETASQANVFLALNSKAIGNYNQALVYLAKALRLNGRNSGAAALTVELLTQQSWPVVIVAMNHDAPVSSAQFSSDGQRVVTASHDKTARVWDAATGKALSEPMNHEAEVYSARFSADGQTGGDRLWG
jgi:hypothetical protein